MVTNLEKRGLHMTVDGYLDSRVKTTSSDTKVQQTQKLITMVLDSILIKLS